LFTNLAILYVEVLRDRVLVRNNRGPVTVLITKSVHLVCLENEKNVNLMYFKGFVFQFQKSAHFQKLNLVCITEHFEKDWPTVDLK
jgi:hypothetical protein